MKILEINAFYYHRGGSESVFFNTTDLLTRHGHQVIPFTLKWAENIPTDYSSYFPESKETRSGLLRPVGNIVNYFYHFDAARQLERLIDDERPDIAQIHLIWGQLTPSILRVLRRKGVPAVLTVHDYRLVCPDFLFRNGRGEICEECQGERFWKCVVNRCCRGSIGMSMMMAAEQYTRNAFFNPARLLDGIVYVSDFSREIHERYMPALSKVPNIRLYNTAPSIADKPLEADDYYLFFGRLSDEKGIGTLISAAHRLPEARFRVAGTGPLEGQMRERVSRHKVSNVEFLGFRTGEDLRDLVSRARMVIVPSECYENNPMTIVEAYSAGVPVIGSAIGGIPEIIREGVTGYTFRAGDPESLAGTVRKAQSLSAAQLDHMRREALEFARSQFDTENYYKSLTAFFSRLTSDRR